MPADPTADPTADPVRLPPPGGRALRATTGVIVLVVGGLQAWSGAAADLVGPVVGGLVLVLLGAVLLAGAGRGAVVGRGGIHDPNRLRDRDLPWSTVEALRTVPVGGDRVRLVVERVGQPPEAAVRIATLRDEDARRLLPAVEAHAAAHDVRIEDGPTGGATGGRG